MKKILITGVTGFLGSHICREIIAGGNCEILALIRENSNLSKISDFKDEILLLKIDNDNWENQIIQFQPEEIIHLAWSGVSSKDRDNWETQYSNLDFTIKLLELAKKVNSKRFIGFGSQAEYGVFSGVVEEERELCPTTAYGASKTVVAKTIELFCKQNNIDWVWFRLFSFFGEGEELNWFIPTLVKNVYLEKEMEMTPGEQRYGYMYVQDLAKIILNVLNTSISSGVYNLSSDSAYSLKSIVQKINNILKPNQNRIVFGAIPYRKNQPMLIQGNNSKLKKEIDFEETNFDLNLESVVYNIVDQIKGNGKI